jgi:hypothetical protein
MISMGRFRKISGEGHFHFVCFSPEATGPPRRKAGASAAEYRVDRVLADAIKR